MGYDLILGMDLLRELSIDILPSRNVITWDDAEIPLRPRDISVEEVLNLNPKLDDPTAVKEAVSRIESILDAKYEKTDLKALVHSLTDLTKDQQKGLYLLLKQHESMFDGTLGT